VRSEATTVNEYLAELPADRREALAEVRAVVLAHLPDGIVETINWGMISYEVPLAVFPDTYNKQPLMFAALASQKNHMALYLSAIYADAGLRTEFEDRYRQSGKRMDMGKSCVRFKRAEDLPLNLVAWAIGSVSTEEFVGIYAKVHTGRPGTHRKA
jgi:uncharacterized protein YdhG (YjbR/CyaY superfamily)